MLHLAPSLPSPTVPASAIQALRAYHSGNNQDALVTANLSLIKTTVDRMRIFLPPVLSIDDLYSVGFHGLLSAVRKFNPSLGKSFTTYATLHIRGAVHDEIRRMDWTPRTIREKGKKFTEILNQLEQDLGRPATPEEVCTEMDISPDQYAALLDEIKPTSFIPLDGESFSENHDDVSLHELIADDNQMSGLQTLEKKELIATVLAQLKLLPEIPRKVMAMYYFEGLRLSEIAAAFQLTEGRISQIHTQAVLSIRAFIQRQDRSAVKT